MKPGEVERWVVQVAERVARGERAEDDRVELKRELPDPLRAARRLAGQANQVRRDRVLWIVGLAEQGPAEDRIFGLDSENPDAAGWWQTVEAQFDSVAPSPTMVNVEFGEKTLLGIGFEADRPPYVIRLASDFPNREVPWREGTHIRSANRSDLLRMLVPALDRPNLTVLGGRLLVERAPAPDNQERFSWHGDVQLYADVASSVVLPDHRCRVWVEFGGEAFELDGAPQSRSGPPIPLPRSRYGDPPLTLGERGEAQFVLHGSTPFAVGIRGTTALDGPAVVPGAPGTVLIQFSTAGPDPQQLEVRGALSAVPPERDLVGLWSIGEPAMTRRSDVP